MIISVMPTYLQAGDLFHTVSNLHSLISEDMACESIFRNETWVP